MSQKFENIVCLGSSFAAGPGIPIGKNYAHQVSNKIEGSQLTDLSVSGSTLEDILSSQIEGVPKDADLILITAGGNDISYVGNMMVQAFKATWFGWFLFLFLSLFPLPNPVDISQDRLVSRVENVLDAVHDRSPKAKVLLVEYLALIGEESDQQSEKGLQKIGYKKEQIEEHRMKQERVKDAYKQAISQNQRSDWCQIVEIHQESQKYHAIGSQEPWVTGFSLYDAAILRKAPLHPNLQGMTAVANKIINHLETNK